MKKTLSILCASIILVLSLCSCSPSAQASFKNVSKVEKSKVEKVEPIKKAKNLSVDNLDLSEIAKKPGSCVLKKSPKTIEKIRLEA